MILANSLATQQGKVPFRGMTSLRPSIQEAESEDERYDSPIIGAGVNEVVKQLLAGRVPGGGE